MFKSLREKLSGWFRKKTEEETGKDKSKEEESAEKEIEEINEGKLEEIKKELIGEIIPEKEDEIALEKEIEETKQAELETPKEELKEELTEEKKGFFGKLIKSITASKLTEEEFNSLFEELEMVLLENNVALEVVDKIKETLSKNLIGRQLKKKEASNEVLQALKNSIEKVLIEGENLIKTILEKEHFVILFFGINGSGKCVHGESNIQLSDGNVVKAREFYEKYSERFVEIDLDNGKIIDVSDGNVIAPSFNPRTLKIEDKRVTHLWKLDKKELIEIKLDNGNDFGIKVTPEHPFFVIRNGNVVKARADEIKESDYVAVLRDVSIAGEFVDLFDDIKKLNLDVYLTPEEAKRRVLLRYSTLKEAYRNLMYRKNYCWLSGDVKKGKIPIELIEKEEFNCLKIKGKLDKRPISFQLFLTSEFAEFLGYIIGDGHIGKNYVEISNEDPEIICRFGELSRILFNLVPSVKRDARTKNMFRVILSSKTLVDCLQIFGLRPGKKGRRLRVPEQVLLSGNDVVRSFIRAYFDCDSWVASKQRTIELVSESEGLIRQMSLLLNRFGIMSTITKKDFKNGYWRLAIRSRYAGKYADKIGFLVRKKLERVAKYEEIGLVQGCGKQDMIPLWKSLKMLRTLLGFSIAEIQKYVGGYGLYENMGFISREKLSELVDFYQNRKEGVFLKALLHVSNGDNLREIFSSYSLNGIMSRLTSQGFVVLNGRQILLTKKGEIYLEEMKNNNDRVCILLEMFESLAQSHVCWIPIREINKIENEEDYVYDLTVEDNHSFIANGFVVHNTTSIAKLAYKLKEKGVSCVLAAGDTFRAASIEQLEEHAKKLDIPMVKHKYMSDPAAVAYDAINYAKKHKIKVVLIDTAGRMYTKTNLMKEMEKIVRVTKPDLRVFVGESIAGNDSVEQAKMFNETVGIDGIILTKADVDEKAGAILSVSYITGKPILYLGLGQSYEDLKEFKKEDVFRGLGLD